MAKYELVKKTEVDGAVWYHITKDGLHVNETWTKYLEEAESLFDELLKGKPLEPIIETLKTYEINDTNDN
jgi:hypothetical protein